MYRDSKAGHSDPYENTSQDFDCLPSSISGDSFIQREAAQPIQWVEEHELLPDPSHLFLHSSNPPSSVSIHEQKQQQQQQHPTVVASGVRAWTKSQAYGASDALVKYATGAPLLPQQVAEMVSNLSVIARVSLKAAAFFIEVILESVRHGTGVGLGITRRALISAVGTAQAVHTLTFGQQQKWDANVDGESLGPFHAANQAFLTVLDRYTAVGIYLIHHSLTLTELFAMSGLQLVSNSITAGFMAAQESVKTIDGIFGSNETSRALASFITLVRGEFKDPRYVNSSTVSVLTKLTKALTAFAVLQNSTYKRSAKSMKMRVIYDCTVLGQVEAKSWRSLIVGSGNFIRNGQPSMLPAPAEREISTPAHYLSRSPTQRLSDDGHNSCPPLSPKMSFMSNSNSGTYFGDGLCLTDIEPVPSFRNSHSDWTSPRTPRRKSSVPDSDSIIADLGFLVGTEENEDLVGEVSSSLTPDQLPLELRHRLQGYSEDQLRNGVVIEQRPTQHQPQRLRHIVKRDQGRSNRETVYEITTEVIETIETVTTVEEQEQSDFTANSLTVLGSDGTPNFSRRRRGSSITHRDVQTLKSGSETRSIFEGGHEVKVQQDEEWCEIRTTKASQEHKRGTSNENFGESSVLLSSPHLEASNGRASSPFDVFGSPQSKIGDDSSRKTPVVLKTITKKLIQKRKTIRRIELHDDNHKVASPTHLTSKASEMSPRGFNFGSEPRASTPVSPAGSMPESFTPPSADTASPHVSELAHTLGAVTGEMGRGLQKVLRKAKQSIKNNLQLDHHASSQKRVHTDGTQLKAGSTETPDLFQAGNVSNLSSSSNSMSLPHEPWSSGLPSPSKRASLNPSSKPLPIIPQRKNSHMSAQPMESKLPPTTPQTTRRKQPNERPRARSITSVRSFASRTHVQSTTTGGADHAKHGRDPTAFPQAHLVENLRRFVRYSSAAYGQNFMRILGIGSLDYFFPDTSKHHANVWAFAHHVGIPVDRILLNSFSETQPVYSEKMSPLVNYVAVDDLAKAVVLTCRGTMGLSDILTDLTCEFEDIMVEGGKPHHQYQVHSGMLASTRRLCDEKSTVMQTIRLALEDNPDYGLVITGHSLGGGVAALAAIELSCPVALFRRQVLQQRADHANAVEHPRLFTPFVTSLDSGLPPGRPIHAYAYGVPAISSPDLSKHCQGLVTSVVHGHDFIPTLSLGMVHDFKNVAQTLSEQTDTDVAKEIVGKVIDVYRQRKEKRKGLKDKSKLPAHLSALEAPRPQEAPLSEREMKLSHEELLNGKTRNLAHDSGYQDPSLLEDEMDPFSYSAGGGRSFSHLDVNADDSELSDWLWSLIKTIRADMDSAKLYPPGDVYCIESFPVFVTSRMQPDSNTSQPLPSATKSDDGVKRGQAHRVILRYCEDVEKRFSEPIFAKSMLRDHIPTNYELCMSLLYESMTDAPET